MLTVTIYMFHSIGTGNDLEGADPHYSYSLDKFVDLLEAIGPCRSIASNLEKSNIFPILTFDDGHASNYLAAKILKERFNSTADFFINPVNVGKKNYLSWNQLIEMDAWGMSIQSHSYEHVYLSDLNYEEQKNQLKRSKEIIEDRIGKPVVILAPPGGRYNSNTERLCRELSYQHISVSRPGKWNGGYCSSRVPVQVNTSVKSLVSCNNQYSFYLFILVIKYKITGVAKKIMGNGRYDTFREKILSVIS